MPPGNPDPDRDQDQDCPCRAGAGCGGIPRMSVRRLWTSLDETKKREVARAIAAAYHPGGLPPDLALAVGAAIGFRPVAVRRGTVDQTTGYLYRAMPSLSQAVAVTLLVKYFTDARVEMLSDVYEALGIEHDGPEVADEVLEQPLDTDKALSGVAGLAGKHPAADLLFCFEVMELACTPAWRPAVAAVRASLETAPTTP